MAKTLENKDFQINGKKIKSFLTLCKLRVNSLIVFTAVIGMFLSTPGMVPWDILFSGIVGIGFVAAAAAAFNCLIEQSIDAKMARTRARPLGTGKISQQETLVLASILGGMGLATLFFFVNFLTMWLTLITFFAYAAIYTVFLKPATPMNIVIGGASGAMPPVLGWAAVNNQLSPEAWILFLIIFCWTPPHFWALALYRREEYAKVGIPMLPVTHGEKFTLLHIVLYTIILVIVTMMPFSVGMTGLIYLFFATILNAIFLYYVIVLYRNYSDKLSKKIFNFSILYLSLIFTAFLVDHYYKFIFI